MVCLSVMFMGPAKMPESIRMPGGLWIQVGPRNHALDGGPDPPREGVILSGKGGSYKVYREHRRCAATMQPSVKLL